MILLNSSFKSDSIKCYFKVRQNTEGGKVSVHMTTQGRKGLWLQGELHQLVIIFIKKNKSKEKSFSMYTSCLL